MKKILSLLTAACLLFLFTACASQPAETDGGEQTEETPAVTERESVAEEAAEPDPLPEGAASGEGILVVYFSRTGENYNVGVIEKGNTAVLADMIAEQTGADRFEIVPVTPYPDNYNDCLETATQEQRDNARPEYHGDVENWTDYETIFFGYPIWWGDLPMIAYSFLENHDWNGKTVIPFNTHEGSGQAGTQRIIERLCVGAEVADGLAIAGNMAQNSREEARNRVETWLSGLHLPELSDTTDETAKADPEAESLPTGVAETGDY